jgi:hypothetical protein
MSYMRGPADDPRFPTPMEGRAPAGVVNSWSAAAQREDTADPRQASVRTIFAGQGGFYPVLMVGFFVVFLIFLLYLQTRTDVGANGTLRGISDLFVLFGALVCTISCWYTANKLRTMRSRGDILARRAWIAWLLLGAAAATYALGQAIWTWYDAHYMSSQLPFPATYDPFYLLVYPLSWVGVAVLIPQGGTAAGRTRLLLDAGIAVASALAITWYFILGPTLESLSGSPIEKIVALAYPLGDLSLCVAAALLLFGQSGAAALNGSLGRLAIGVTWLALTDSLYGYSQLQGTYHTGLLQDIGWPMSWLFIGWAALVYPDAVARLTGRRLDPRPATRLNTTGVAIRAVTPIVLAILTCVVLLLEVALRNAAPLIQVVLVCAGLIFLPVVRQLLTLIDNLILNERLRMALGQSQQAYQQSQRALVATSSRADRYDELREGIENLQAVHAQIARGDFGARAQVQGVLAPVAQSLNLLLDRLNRWTQVAQVNQMMEGEVDQLRHILEEMSRGQVAHIPTSQSSLSTGEALLAAAHLQRQLQLHFSQIRGAVETLGRNWGGTLQSTQDMGRAVQERIFQQLNATNPRDAQMIQNALAQIERGMDGSQAALQNLWRNANLYIQYDAASSPDPRSGLNGGNF